MYLKDEISVIKKIQEDYRDKKKYRQKYIINT